MRGNEAPAFDAAAAKALLLEGLAEEGIDIASLDIPVQYRPAPRGYVNDPPGVAQDVVAQLQENLGLKAHTDEHENTTYLGESNAGTLEGLFLLGWGMDFPDVSNFMTYHFGSGTGVKFGDPCGPRRGHHDGRPERLRRRSRRGLQPRERPARPACARE